MSSPDSPTEGPSFQASKDPQEAADAPRLNPDMFYRPTTPTLGQHQDKAEALCAIGFPFNMIVLVRFCVFCLTLTNIILQLIGSLRTEASVVLVVITFFIFFWNLAMLLAYLIPPKLFKKTNTKIPEVSCTIGQMKFNFCGGSDDETDTEYAIPKSTSMRRSLPYWTDSILAILLLTFIILRLNDRRPYYYYYEPHYTPVIIVHFFVMIIEFSLIILQYFAACGPLNVSIKARLPQAYDHDARIQLPQDHRSATASSKQPISVVA